MPVGPVPVEREGELASSPDPPVAGFALMLRAEIRRFEARSVGTTLACAGTARNTQASAFGSIRAALLGIMPGRVG